jgi:coenzyme F420 hydrogenase subunit beta
MDSIEKIVSEGLCTQCGTCVGVCPYNAIKMIKSEFSGLLLPQVEKEKCNLCGLCLKVCPGHSVNFQELNNNVFGQQPRDRLLGNYLKCYVGHSNDYYIRSNSASGGIASQILIFALENQIIDGALVTKMKKDKPLETEPFIARSKEEILSAFKSKYCPVPANKALKQILAEAGRFAIVGLPCHIHGIRKAGLLNPELRKKIVLHICLMCSHTVNFLGTEFIIQKMRVPKEQVSQLSYRGRGWPGAMTIKLKNRSLFSIPLVGSWISYWPIFSSFFFTPTRCTMCPDQTGELADISLGDAWLPELRSEKIGKSIIITRTKAAESILSEMVSSKAISIMRVEPEKVIQSQLLNLKFKKDDLSTRLSMVRFFGRQVPNFITIQNSWSLISFLRALYIYFNIKISSSKRGRFLLDHLPFPFFRLYFGIYKLLCLA